MSPYPAKILPALQQLGAATVAIGIAAAVVAARVTPRGHGTSSLDQTRRMLHHVQDEVRAARAVTPNPALRTSSPTSTPRATPGVWFSRMSARASSASASNSASASVGGTRRSYLLLASAA